MAAQIYFAVSDKHVSFRITGKQVHLQTVKIEEMPHNQGLHCKNINKSYMHHNLEISTGDPLKYKMGNSILILSICLGTAIRMKRG